ncbi:toxin-antitoxin system YwqK family antitoxin [Desulfatibacillum aliphaticivorans]|uniref:toxin-antitoxin system YwqK family antitoxin n=1 Tax=Desulfatibacillum aliphaticivorans TaxID=218208 RepID=UPI0004872FA7|nr:toxin-antitoxin system YwqK family antitoxin [Desulfatibacillum aliphaticivorans]
MIMMNSYEKIIRWPLSLRFWETGREYAKGRIEDGLRQGMWTFWYRSGAKQMEGEYKDGVQVGLWIKWWPNGQVATQGAFKDGWMHGEWNDWFDNGQKAMLSHWDMGRKTGVTTIWDRFGNEVKSQKHRAGREPRNYYPLMSNRDASFALATAQKMGMRNAWTRMVGKKVAAYLEPWQCTVWLMLFLPGYALLKPKMGLIAIPVSLVGAALISIGVVLATAYHDSITRPDIGLGKPKD